MRSGYLTENPLKEPSWADEGRAISDEFGALGDVWPGRDLLFSIRGDFNRPVPIFASLNLTYGWTFGVSIREKTE